MSCCKSRQDPCRGLNDHHGELEPQHWIPGERSGLRRKAGRQAGAAVHPFICPSTCWSTQAPEVWTEICGRQDWVSIWSRWVGILYRGVRSQGDAPGVQLGHLKPTWVASALFGPSDVDTMPRLIPTMTYTQTCGHQRMYVPR